MFFFLMEEKFHLILSDVEGVAIKEEFRCYVMNFLCLLFLLNENVLQCKIALVIFFIRVMCVLL